MDIALEELKKERRLAASRLAEIDRAIIELSPNVERYINLRDFMSEKHDFTWLIGGFLARGTMSMLVADAGTGKSTLMAQLTLSLVHGKPFLGGRIEKPARVLLLAAEGARAAFQGRIRTAIRALGYVVFRICHDRPARIICFPGGDQCLVQCFGTGHGLSLLQYESG